MLDRERRAAVLLLRQQGHSLRAIASALGISRDSVVAVLAAGTADVPAVERPSQLDSLAAVVAELHTSCRGNLKRVHEELCARGHAIGYATLTDWCRRQGLGKKKKRPAGEYRFGAGEEMQHDTSPHHVKLGDSAHLLQCASLILGFSRMQYAQVFWRFRRLEARIFLSEGLTYFGGAAKRCVIDNTSVIIAHGTGKDAVPAAELEALADRFGFRFLAHEPGDKNRSGKVERPFHFVEHNFYPGRHFADIDDCNRQLRAWCDQKNGAFRRHLHARPTELLVSERPSLSPLPIFVPEIYEPHSRMVDLTGCVTLHTNRYSAPPELIDRRVEVREYKACVRIFVGPRQVAEHPLLEPGRDKSHRLPEHRIRGDAPLKEMRARPIAEETRLRAADPLLASYVDGLRRHRPGRAVVALRRLDRLWTEYPAAAVLGAVADAQRYGLYDLGRLERMILRRVAGEYFNGPPTRQPGSDSGPDDER